MSKEESLLSLDIFKKKLIDKKAIKDAREKEAKEYHLSLVKEVNKAGEKFIENIIPYLDEYQNTVGGGNELLLKVDNSKYDFHISYYEMDRLYMDVNLVDTLVYRIVYKKPHSYNSYETIGFPELDTHLIALKHLFDGNSIINKIANALLRRLSWKWLLHI